MMDIYNGNEPYIFISYAHKDSATVLPLIDALQQRGFRVWYDAGIAAGTEWPEYIADRLGDSACVVAFVSAAALASHNCRREINFAIHLQKEMLVVYLEEVELSRGMTMQLGVLQALFRNRFGSNAAFLDALCEAEVIASCRNTAAPVSGEDAIDALQREATGMSAKVTLITRLLEAQNFFSKQQYAQAFKCYLALAEEGDASAAAKVGQCYLNGHGCVPDAAQALHWYTKAAEAGDADSQNQVGGMWLEGKGCTADMTKAAYWFGKSAEAGNCFAANNLGWLCQNGLGVPQDYAAAARWYRKGAEAGNAEAANNLGWM